MAKAILCDKCGKAKNDDSYYESDTEKDFDVFILGESIASFDDLCDECSDTLIGEIIELVGRDSINLTVAEEEPVVALDEPELELEYLGEIEDFGVEIIETEYGIEFGGDE